MSIRILITAGPTREPIDAVRYLSNRSSGQMGVALAEAAHAAGSFVTLLLGPGTISPPVGVQTIRFETTDDLARLLAEHLPNYDVLIMAAAVADYRPVQRSGESKIARRSDGLVLELEPTPDLLAGCVQSRRPGQLIIGFALEDPAVLLERAGEKLKRKGADAIVANPLQTMDAGEIDATLLTPDGLLEHPGPMTKRDLARWLMQWINRRMTSRQA